MSALSLGLLFIASGAVVTAGGTVLARCAEVIAQRTGIGRLWTGAVLLATATSLPELGTDIAAVRMGAIDLAVGDAFGSCMANMLVLALIDMVAPRKRVLRSATLDHALSACLAISLNALAVAAVLTPSGYSVAGVSPESLLLAGAYVFGTRAVYRHATRTLAAPPVLGDPQSERPSGDSPSLRRAVQGFVLAAVVILAATPVFAYSAKGIADVTGLGGTFVGTWLVGLSTSLPELVASLAAVRIGAFDLAVGNLFGSNAFNMSILLWLDLADPGGSLFLQLDRAHALSGVFAIVLTSLGLAAIVYRAEKRFTMLEPDSALIVVMYAIAILLLYTHR